MWLWFHYSPLTPTCSSSFCSSVWTGLSTALPPTGCMMNRRKAPRLGRWEKMLHGQFLTKSLKPLIPRCVHPSDMYIYCNPQGQISLCLRSIEDLNLYNKCLFFNVRFDPCVFFSPFTVWKKSEAEWNHQEKFTKCCCSACVSIVSQHIGPLLRLLSAHLWPSAPVITPYYITTGWVRFRIKRDFLN